MSDKFDVILDVVFIIRLAYGSPAVKDFSALISSFSDTLSSFGEHVQTDDTYKLDLSGSGMFTLGTPKAKDTRKFASLSSAKLCHQAIFYFFEVLKFVHCPDIDWFAHHQAAAATFFEQLSLQVEGDIDSLHQFLERGWLNFARSLRDNARAALRISEDAPFGSHAGTMLIANICFFEGPASPWWSTIVEKARRRRVNDMCDSTAHKLASLQSQFSSLQSSGQGGGGGGGGRGALGGRAAGSGGGGTGAGAGGGGGGRGGGATPTVSAGGGTKSKSAKRAASRAARDGTPKRLKMELSSPAGQAKGAWASVELGFVGEKLSKPDECRKALQSAGFDNAGAARTVWGKDASNRGLCFWHNSPYGKAGGGCPYGKDCKFAPCKDG
jgi:hypothetical protein